VFAGAFADSDGCGEGACRGEVPGVGYGRSVNRMAICSMFMVGSWGCWCLRGVEGEPRLPRRGSPSDSVPVLVRGSAVEPSSRAVLAGGARWSTRRAARMNDLRSPTARMADSNTSRDPHQETGRDDGDVSVVDSTGSCDVARNEPHPAARVLKTRPALSQGSVILEMCCFSQQIDMAGLRVGGRGE
jgi:hypothetical protein